MAGAYRPYGDSNKTFDSSSGDSVDIGSSEPDDEGFNAATPAHPTPQKKPNPPSDNNSNKDPSTTTGMANTLNDMAGIVRNSPGGVIPASYLKPYGSGTDMSKLGAGKPYGSK